MRSIPPLPVNESKDADAVRAVALGAQRLGGRALLVGGFVRDAILAQMGQGQPSKDLDVEVFGLDLDSLRALLSDLGVVDEIGASFAVLRVRGIDVDFSLPRRDQKTGSGHRGFLVSADPSMSLEQAARRRDFTVNSISADPLTGEVIDPVGGGADLREGVLRATDSASFGEDPLRALRAVQMAARFSLVPSKELPALMASQDLGQLPAERVEQELSKFLLRGVMPSRGIELLRDGCGLNALPGLETTDDVWWERAQALDRWVHCRPGERALALAEGWTLLSLGTTHKERLRLFGRVRPPVATQKAVLALHAVPLPETKPGVRKAARALGVERTSLASLFRVHASRSIDVDVPRGLAVSVGLLHSAPKDVVLGRHLLALGLTPSPRFGELLSHCRAVQDETGLDDADEILRRALEY